MTENFEAPTLLGLTVLLAPAKTGKTEALRLSTGSWDGPSTCTTSPPSP
jgi:hypothetical protein